MIHYLVTERHAYTFANILEHAGPELRRRLRVLPYERLPRTPWVPSGVFLFTDLERLPPAIAETAARVWERLDGAPGVQVLNHPTRSFGRYRLLRSLHESGWNRFDVQRADECRTPARFPVFLREEGEHGGADTPLLRSETELRHAIRDLEERGRCLSNRLVVEFLDTSDREGVFRKYAAYLVGDRVLPRHLFFGRDWMLKVGDIDGDADRLREERAYLEENPHEEQIREVFRLARIRYGRIDYGVLDGRIQVWEINTNPMYAAPGAWAVEARNEVNRIFFRRFRDALVALDESVPRSRRGVTLRRIPGIRPPLWKRLAALGLGRWPVPGERP